MNVFALPDVVDHQLCAKTCFSSLDVSKLVVSGLSSMYNVIMQYLNSFFAIKAITENQLHDFLINSRHLCKKYC